MTNRVKEPVQPWHGKRSVGQGKNARPDLEKLFSVLVRFRGMGDLDTELTTTSGRERRSIRAAIICVALIISLASVSVFTILSGLGVGNDYATFFAASRLPLSALYSGPPFTYIYPPTGIPFLMPLTATGYWEGFVWITVISIVAYCLAVTGVAGRKVAFLSLLSFPALEGLAWGQTVMLLAAGLFFALTMSGFRRGFVIGALAAIKPQLFVAAPLIFLARKDHACFAGTLVGGGSAVLVSVGLFGLQPWADWLAVLPNFQSLAVEYIPGAVISPIGFALGNGIPVIPVAITSTLIAGWVVMRTRMTDDPAIIAAVIGGASILCSPYAMFHDCIFLMPATVSLLLRDSPTFRQFPAILAFSALALPISLPALLLTFGTERPKVAKTSNAAAKLA